MTNHTPGPWTPRRSDSLGNHYTIEPPAGDPNTRCAIAQVMHGDNAINAANAALIAAAPDLLAALEAIANHAPWQVQYDFLKGAAEMQKIAMDAIAKAKGGV